MKVGIVISRMAALLLIATVLLVGGTARAGGADLNPAYRQIAAELGSAGPASVDLAEADIRNMVKYHALSCRRQLRRSWLPELMEKRQYQFVAEIARREIFNTPAWPANIQRALRFRIAALLALGQSREALAEAKSLFNECTMRNTGATLSIVARCLRAALPDGAAESRRLKREQIAGAKAPQPGTQAATCAVLSGIKVDAAPYLMRAWSRLGQGYYDLMGRGDLLLLADKPKAAMVCFLSAYAASEQAWQLTQAAGRIAACIKAEDGTIGRANAWVDKTRR